MSIERLSGKTNLYDIVTDPYFIENFYAKYINDIPLFAFEMCGIELTWQQIEVVKDFSYKGGRKAVASGHGTGKTRLEGVILLHFLILHEFSIARVIAPVITQITNYVFKEFVYCVHTFKTPKRLGDKVVINEWAFLMDFIVVTKTKMYIKGCHTSWYIEAKTAPKGEAEKLSGQHNKYYLLILEEASGIEDTHIENSLGALTEEVNSCLAFSQETRQEGKFYEFMNTNPTWQKLRLNSEESPRVTIEALREFKSAYTDDQYRIKVQGLGSKNKNNERLIEPEDIEKLTHKKKWLKDFKPTCLIVSADVATSGRRDKSVRVLGRAMKIVDDDKETLYIILDDVQVPKKFIKNQTVYYKPMAMAVDTIKEIIKISRSKLYKMLDLCLLAWDANTIGNEAYDEVEEMSYNVDEFDVEPNAITWGDRGRDSRLQGIERTQFYNERAKAFYLLNQALENETIYADEDLPYLGELKKELKSIPYFLTSTGAKIQVESKDKMAKSPDIADCLAQMYLLDYPITETSSNSDNGDIIIDTEDINIDDTNTEDKNNDNDDIKELLPEMF